MKDENENNQPGNREQSFGLPEGYFHRSAQSIFNKIAWQEEHREFPTLLTLQKKNGFRVPEASFPKTEQKLELLQYPVLRAVPQLNPFLVPGDYFQDHELKELARALENTNDELSGLDTLMSIKKQNSFVVDAGYFEKNEAILEKRLISKPAKVISLYARIAGYGVAAMLLLVLGIWIYTVYNTPVQPEDCGTIACLDKQDLMQSKNLERLDDDELYELVDPSVLQQKLEVPGAGSIQEETPDSAGDLYEDELLEDL
jgi:hypothetical protein